MAMTTALATLLAGGLTAAAGAGSTLLAAKKAKKQESEALDQGTTSAKELDEAMMEEPDRKPNFGLSGANNILFPSNPLKKRPPFMG